MRRRLTVVIAPDSYKGTLTSVQVARAIADGWREARPDDELRLAPLADGGEGTLAAIAEAGGWSWRETRATDPIGRTITARWLTSEDGDSAIVELAEASGLSRVASAERDPIGATTFGTGEVLRAALEGGAREITLGIGGSATTDGGAGILRALGVEIRDDGIDLSGMDARLAETRLRIACDVTNPLLGPRGAAATYGPQKGASPEQVRELDRRLARFADALAGATGRDERETPGAGAAGGTAFGLLSIAERFAAIRLVPGVQVVMEEIRLGDKLAGADLVLTGEGRIDAQTAFGKTALGVAEAAREAGVPCIAIGGSVEPEGEEALWAVAAIAISIAEAPATLQDALAAGTAPILRAARRVARTVAVLD